MSRHTVTRCAATLAVAILMAACGSSATPTPEFTPTVEPTSEPTNTLEASPTPTLEPSDAPVPSEGGATSLAALLPDEVNDITLFKVSLSGAELAAGGAAGPMAELYEKLGADPEDVGMAMASGDSLAILVFQAVGVETQHLLTTMRDEVYGARAVPVEFTEEVVHEKTVYTALEPEQNNQKVYLYATGDLLFVVSAADPALSETLIGLLP